MALPPTKERSAPVRRQTQSARPSATRTRRRSRDCRATKMVRQRRSLPTSASAGGPRWQNREIPPTRPQKITLATCAMGIRGLLVYCSDYKCSHNVEISADPWPDDFGLSDLEPLFKCQPCG